MTSQQGTIGDSGSHFCAHCGTENPADAYSCDRCGERIYLPNPLKPPPLGLVECQNCVTANEARASYCVKCGKSLANAARISVLNSGEAVRQAPHSQPGGIRISQRNREIDARPVPGQPQGRERVERREDEEQSRPQPRTREPERDRERREQARARANEAERSRAEASEGENNSGTRTASLPQSARGWNTAAFLIGPIWGPANGVWLGVVGLIFFFIPESLIGSSATKFLLYLAYGAFLGYRGNLLAWRARRWVSLEHFKRVQQQWMLLALVFGLGLVVTLPWVLRS